METRNFNNGLIFDLPLIAHIVRLQPNWLLDPASWVTDNYFKKTFLDARDGQGFSGIVYIEKKPMTDKYLAKVTLNPAFNGDDGLAKETKYGEPYMITQYVDTHQGSPGMVHKTSVKKEILNNLFQNSTSTLSKRLQRTLEEKNPLYLDKSPEEKTQLRNKTIIEYYPKLLDSSLIQENAEKLKGFTFGFSITKGAESKNHNDYEIIRLKDVDQINQLHELFNSNRNKILVEYDKNKKYLLLIETLEPDTFVIFYIQNQKIVRRPHYNDPDIKPSKVNINKEDDKEMIVEKCLKALNLYYPLIINNKSASQNNSSVSYDFDFESYTMYIDRKKYLDEDALTPEGNEWGSLYDLKRSLPISLMFPLTKSIFSTLETKITDEMLVHQKKWNSWDNPQRFENVLDDFLNASQQKKWEIFENNIHITARLYENTLKIFLFHHCSQKVMDEHPSFKTHFVNYGGYVCYLLELENRLDQLLMSYFHVVMECKENPGDLIHSTKYIPTWLKTDTRTLEKVFADCISIATDIELNGFITLSCIDSTKKIIMKIKNIQNLHDNFLQEAHTCIKKMFVATHEKEILMQFVANQKNFIHYIRHALADKTIIDAEIKHLLEIKDNDTGKSLLEHVTENNWENAIALFKGYGASETQSFNRKRKNT